MRRMGFGLLVACFALALILAPAAFAQNFTGSVRGTVGDEQGAAIAGADVAITNADTGDSRTEKSDKNGSYGFQSLPIGRYTLRVAKEGFKAFEEKDIILHVNDSLTVDAQMKVGAKTETVEVVANATQVELNNAELSGTIAGAQITQLPLNGRSFAELLTLVPGVEVDNGFSYDKKGLNGGADISVSGGASNANLFLVDGANNVDVGSNRTILIYPSLDSIEEFKIERNSYSAQFGGAGGGIVSLVTKSGTNDYHGSAYYFGRNDLLDSFDSFLKATNPTAKKNTIRRNDFGGSVGGPIMKDKIFFFGSEEWNRLIQESVRSAHVPTPLQRTGDFSDSALDPAAASPNTSGCLLKGGLVDPDPTNPGGAFKSAASTVGIIDVIPATRQSAAGAAILNTYFLPTLPATTNGSPTPNYGCGTNWAKSEKQPTYFREDSWRGDVRLSKTLTLMMRYTNDAWTFGPSAVGNTGWGADAGASQIQESWSSPGRITVGRLSKTIGTSAVNDFQFSYSSNRIDISQATPSAAQALNKLIPTFFPTTGNPASNPPVWINGGGLPTIWSFAPWHNGEDLYAWQDDFSKVIRRHTLKFGALYSRNSKDQDNFSQKQGVTFGPGGYNGCKKVGDPGCTNLTDVTTHYGLADWILQNQAVNWGEQNVIFKKQGRWENFELYLQDDLKLTSRLTVNLGVRYSYLPNPYQADDQFTVFNQAAFNPALLNAPCNGLFYSAGLLTNPCPAQFDTGKKDANGNEIIVAGGGLPGPNRAIQYNYNRGFGPRLGVAWDPTGSGKWAVRAGFGQFYNRDDIFVTDGTAGTNPPFIRSFNSPNGNGRFLDNTSQLPACAPNCFGAGGFGVPSIGQDLNSRAPYTLQYNLTIQHEFWKDTRLEVGYVGSRTKNWTSKYDANAVAPSNRLAFAQSNGNAAGNLLKPFDALASGTIAMFSHHGSAQYDSLQSAFSTRFQRNSIFQLTYTYSKTYADTLLKVSNGGGNLVLDPFNLKNGYGLNPLNRPHIFSANVIYNLPALQNMERFVRAGLGSWELSSILNITSGHSLTPTIGGISNVNDPSGIGNGAGAQRPNLVAGQSCRNPSFANFQWINPNRYSVNGLQLGTIGNAPVGDCLGPPTRTVDFSISKNFHITERIKAQFRMDAFNLFNHPQYTDPGGNGVNYNIGFNATAANEFLDANGNPTPTLTNAASLRNTSPNSQVGTVNTQSDRNREFQYSIRFTF
jgi:Carboxypeptidase regulatory-like domain/TonB-dependent Receptor Plug Domain